MSAERDGSFYEMGKAALVEWFRQCSAGCDLDCAKIGRAAAKAVMRLRGADTAAPGTCSLKCRFLTSEECPRCDGAMDTCALGLQDGIRPGPECPMSEEAGK